MPTRKPIAVGEKFFRLTVISNAPNRKGSSGANGSIIYCVQVRCDCGNILIVPEYKLRAKHTKSCGCLQVEKAKDNLPASTHGHSARRNGKALTFEYKAWMGMKQRCNRKYGEWFKHYGARGIKVCDRWFNSFENFLADMGPHPGEGFSIDRINANGNYEPSNCRWANWEEQARNRRNNRNVIVNNVTMCVSQAVMILNTHQSKVCRMVNKLNITYQKAIDLLMLNPRPVNMRQFKAILKSEENLK